MTDFAAVLAALYGGVEFKVAEQGTPARAM